MYTTDEVFFWKRLMVACSSAVRYREGTAPEVFGTPVIKVCVGSIRVFGVEAAKAGGTKSPASIDAIIAPAERAATTHETDSASSSTVPLPPPPEEASRETRRTTGSAMTVGTAVRPDGRGREGGRPPRGAADAQGRRYDAVHRFPKRTRRRYGHDERHRSGALSTSGVSATSTGVKGHPDARGQYSRGKSRARGCLESHSRHSEISAEFRTQSTDHCDAIPLGKHCVGTRQLSSISNLALHLLRANESKHREFFSPRPHHGGRHQSQLLHPTHETRLLCGW